MERNNYVAEEYYSDENHWNNFIVFDNTKNGVGEKCDRAAFRDQHGRDAAAAPSRSPFRTACRASRSRSVAAAGDSSSRLRGQLALVQRCLSDKGRHSFMCGQPIGSGNVFLDCKATSPYSSSEPHEQWTTGNVYDNVEAPLTARFWKNINIGWAGANTVFWNCKGDFLVQKPPTAQNYTFGHIGVDASRSTFRSRTRRKTPVTWSRSTGT